MPTHSDSNGPPPAAAEAPVDELPEAPGSPSPAPSRERGPAKTPRERAEEKRKEKLDQVREQVESGSLVIRPMTVEERRRYPPRPVAPKRFGKR